MFLNPLHPTEQRYRHPAGPRYDRVEHRVHNICRYLYAEISPRGLKLLFALIKLPRFLDKSVPLRCFIIKQVKETIKTMISPIQRISGVLRKP
jgi:hypothetical protein